MFKVLALALIHPVRRCRYWSIDWWIALCCIPDHVSVRRCFSSSTSHTVSPYHVLHI